MVREALGNNNAIVVAHPDDEVIWCGGLPIKFRGVCWTVIVCSIPVDERNRAWQVYDACAVLGAECRVLPIEDRGMKIPLKRLEMMRLEDMRFDAVVTHGDHGEYGHPHHKQVNEYVLSVFSGPVVTFGWHGNDQGQGGGGDYGISLEEPEVARKMQALATYDQGPELKQVYFGRYGVPMDRETYNVSMGR